MQIGDLTPNMIASQHVSVRTCGATITGRLNGLHITTETSQQTGFHDPQRTHTVWIALTIGRTRTGYMEPDRTIQLIEEDHAHS